MKSIFLLCFAAILYSSNCPAQPTLGFDIGASFHTATINIQDWHDDGGNIIIDGYHPKTTKAIAPFINIVPGYNYKNVIAECELKYLMGNGFYATPKAGYQINISETFSITPMAGYAPLNKVFSANIRAKEGDVYFNAEIIGPYKQFSFGLNGFVKATQKIFH